MKPDNDRKKRRRVSSLSFSLLSFVLLISVICASLALYRSHGEVRRLSEEVESLKHELGYIEVVDPEKAYVWEIGPAEKLRWNYRVYLPPGKTYQVSWKTGSDGGGQLIRCEGQFHATVSLIQNGEPVPYGGPLRFWEIHLLLGDSKTGHRFLGEELPPFLPRTFSAGRATSPKEFDPNSRIEMLRIGQDDEKHLVVFIEPARNDYPKLPPIPRKNTSSRKPKP